MKNADIALYHAKLERDRISIYSPDFDVNTVERLKLLADLRAALDSTRAPRGVPTPGGSDDRAHRGRRGAGAVESPHARLDQSRRLHPCSPRTRA